MLTEIGRTLDLCLLDLSSAQVETAGFRTAAAACIDHARFALLLTCSGRDEELSTLQRQVVDRLSQPVRIAGQTVFLSACVGVAIHPRDADDADTLLQRADNAMRDAQSRGGGFRFYSTATDAAAARKLKLEGKAETAGTVLFSFDLVYAGIFRLQNIPKDNIHPVMMIECPRLLFPFAREMIATAVRNGGFPPLLIDPVDFVSLYRQRMTELQAKQPAAPAG